MSQLFTFHLGTTGKAATTTYEFLDEAGASLGAASGTGVTEIGTTGIYFRTQALPAGAVTVVWNETTLGRWAVDDFISRAGGGLDAAGVRAAVGLASANLDTQLGDLPTAIENCDELLNRDMSAVFDTTLRSPLNALRFIRNKWSISGNTLTVTKEDDTTTAWTATVTTSAGADPIVGNDPA